MLKVIFYLVIICFAYKLYKAFTLQHRVDSLLAADSGSTAYPLMINKMQHTFNVRSQRAVNHNDRSTLAFVYNERERLESGLGLRNRAPVAKNCRLVTPHVITTRPPSPAM